MEMGEKEENGRVRHMNIKRVNITADAKDRNVFYLLVGERDGVGQSGKSVHCIW